MTMPEGFKVTCDECGVVLSYGDAEFGMTVSMPPDAARCLAQMLIVRAKECEDANEHEMEQMA